MKRLWLTTILLVCLPRWAGAFDAGTFLDVHAQRMDDLFSALDENQPALSGTLALWDQGDRTGALQAVVAYFRDQAFDLSLIEPAYLPGDFLQHADAALENRFLIHGGWYAVPRPASGGIDWNYRGPDGDKEIAWMLNRHVILPILGEAYRHTGKDAYRDKLNAILTDWITSSPYPGRMTFSPQWRALEAARRVLNSWIHIFHGYNELLDDETLLLMLGSLPDHADALFAHASFWGGNHLLTEKTALLALATAWPGFSGSADWTDDAIGVVSSQVLKQSYPDGSHVELSNHYQRVVINNTLPFLKLLRHASAEHENSAVDQRIEAMWQYFACAMKPDGSGPLNNASDREDNRHFIVSAWDQFGRRDWLGMATHGREGVLPVGSASRLFPWAGHVFMRSDWGPAAHYVFLDAGPYGTAHQHVDKLHISVSLNGRNLLVDSGRYTYQPGKWKEYFQGPRSHSILLLNGQASDQGPRKAVRPADIHFEQAGGVAYAAGTASFNPTGEWLRAPVPWTRHVVLDKRGFVIVFDQLVAFKRYDVEILWQLAPGIAEEEANRIVRPVGTLPHRQSMVTGRREAPVGGFYSPDYNQLEPVVQLSNRYRIHGPTTLCHVIAPPDSGPMRVDYLQDPETESLQFTVYRGRDKLAEGSLSTGDSRGLTAYTAL